MFNDSNNDDDNENNFIFEPHFSYIQKEEKENKILNFIESKIEDKFNCEKDSYLLKYDSKNSKIVKTYDPTTKLTKSDEKLAGEKTLALEVQKNGNSGNDDSFFEPDFKNNIYNNKNDITELKRNLKPLGKKRGRNGSIISHNKYSDDNLRRKCKHIILKLLFDFINEKIFQKYNNYEGKNNFAKKLLTINQKQTADASIQFNKDFLNKSIGDIFSEDISGKYTNFPPYHNKFLINSLKKDEEKDDNKYFQKIFNLSFLDVLKHFRGSLYIKELDGMKDIELLKEKYNDDEDYLKLLNYYFMNYEDIINKKKNRKNIKERNKYQT